MSVKVKAKVKISTGFLSYLKTRSLGVSELEEMTKYPKQQISQTLNGSIEPTRPFLRCLCELFHMGVEDMVETVFE